MIGEKKGEYMKEVVKISKGYLRKVGKWEEEDNLTVIRNMHEWEVGQLMLGNVSVMKVPMGVCTYSSTSPISSSAISPFSNCGLTGSKALKASLLCTCPISIASFLVLSVLIRQQ
jgi:hypothetical protein